MSRLGPGTNNLLFNPTSVGFGISLALHIVVYFLLFKETARQIDEREDRQPRVVEVTPISQPENRHGQGPENPKFSEKRKSRKRANKNLANRGGSAYELGLTAPDSDLSVINEGDSDSLSIGSNDNPAAPWGSGAGQFERVAATQFMQFIYEQVQMKLFYPATLAFHEIEGTVNARLVIDQQGHCQWPETSISSPDAHLRIYVLDLLKKVCHQSFSQFMEGKQRANVDLSFLFELRRNDTRKKEEEQRLVVGNVLLFYRNGHKDILEWRFGPFRTYFPLPYVDLDFEWLKENWEKIIEGKDPLNEYRETPL